MIKTQFVQSNKLTASNHQPSDLVCIVEISNYYQDCQFSIFVKEKNYYSFRYLNKTKTKNKHKLTTNKMINF